MDTNKLLELYLEMNRKMGTLGWTYQDSMILDHVKQCLYSNLTSISGQLAGEGIAKAQTQLKPQEQPRSVFNAVPFVNR